MNTSAALRLLAAANDDAVLAAWAAVFDEHKMAPEADVSPYDCWEVLQGFLSSGVLSPLEYNSVNLKKAFFNGTRPSTGQIQEVLGRLKYLRANRETHQEPSVSNAKPPMSAFSNESSIVPTERPRGLDVGQRPGGALGPRAPRPELATAFQPRQESLAPAPGFRPIAEPPRERALASRRSDMPCRKIDASLYRGVGEFSYVSSCCGIPLEIEDLGVEDTYENDGDEEGDGLLHEFMFRAICRSCESVYTTNRSQRVPNSPF